MKKGMRHPVRKVFTAVYEKRDRWYIGYVEEVPGVNTQGRTLSETRRNLQEALYLILETNRLLADKELQSNQVVREKIAVNE